MDKLIILSALFLFLAGCTIQQTSEHQNVGGKMKTVFLQIEGFTKSKSGAI